MTVAFALDSIIGVVVPSMISVGSTSPESLSFAYMRCASAKRFLALSNRIIIVMMGETWVAQ